MIRAATIEGTQDLRPLLHAMARENIRFRVSEEAGSQVIWVSSETEVQRCREMLSEWESLLARGYKPQTSAQQPISAYFSGKGAANQIVRAIWYAPISSLMILGAIMVALLTDIGRQIPINSPLLYPLLEGGSALNPLSYLEILTQVESPLQYLQMLAPGFIHFGVIHIVFNTLWIWQLGRMIESSHSKLVYVLVCVFVLFVSNTAQYLWVQANNFGGLSGLVYGQLGFILAMQTLQPEGRLRLPSSTIAVLVGFMILVAVLPLGFIANAAHIGGLIAGIIAGIPVALLVSKKNSSQ